MLSCMSLPKPPSKNIAVPEYCLVDMSGMHSEVKKILTSFKQPGAPLRIVIATIAFGLGIVIHHRAIPKAI